MKATTLFSVARKIATTVARQHGIRVVFEGDGAATDGKTIYLPAVMSGVVLTREEEAVFMGYLDHEIAHCKFTDFPAYTAFAKVNPLQKYLVNVLEDVRIERKYIGVYPGSQADLDAVCEKLEGEAKQKLLTEGEDLGNLTLEKALALIYEEAYLYRSRPLLRTETLLSFPSLLEVPDLVKAAVSSKSTSEVVVAADKIHQILRKLFPNSDSSKLEQVLEQALAQLSAGAGEGTPMSEALLQSLSAAMFVVVSAVKDDKAAQWVKGQMQDLLGDNPSGKPRAGGGGRYGGHGDRIVPPVSTEKDRVFYVPSDDIVAYKQTVDGLGVELKQLKRAVAIYLRSRHKKCYQRGLDAGVLDGDAVWKISTGEFERLFKERRETVLVNTSLSMMVDLSSSMDQGLLKSSVILLSEALLGIPNLRLQIAGFTTEEHSGWGYLQGPGGRSVPMIVPLFKGFDEDVRKVRGRLGSLRTTGYTPLGEAYAFGFESLVARKEPRKVLIVATDGEPSFPCNDSSHNDKLLMKRIKEKCARGRIEVLGLEIGSGRGVLKDVADRTITISSERTMPEAVLEMVKGLVEVSDE